MKQIFFTLALLIPYILMAQDNIKGIQFEEGLSWEQIVSKASAENKYIFVDCYATWCGPCKMMDKEVYTSQAVGDYFNKNFVSVKLQLDKTDADDVEVKKSYPLAEQMIEKYSVSSFPHYLFFNPNGKLVHRAVGYKAEMFFLALANDAVNPEKQNYTLLQDYKEGKKNYPSMPSMVQAAFSIRDAALAEKIAVDYKTNYLDTLSDAKLFTNENLQFIGSMAEKLLNSKDRLFKFLYHQPAEADSIVQYPGFSFLVVKMILTKEEVTDRLWKDSIVITKKPDWDKIHLKISEKYSVKYSESILPNEKINFYERTGNWKEYAKVIDRRLKDNPPANFDELQNMGWRHIWGLNHEAWVLFEKCNAKRVLKKSIKWVDLFIQLDNTQPEPNPYVLDTKANLFYKLGRVNEAITLEEKAIEIATKMEEKAGIKKGQPTISGQMIETLNKMKEGKPTWPES